jgi:hypothetical protein
VVELRPLDAETVRRYLCDDAAGPAARARWEPVLAVLSTEAPVAQALRTPLMVSLARTIYNPRPGEQTEALRDPAELCDQTDRAVVESLLFDAFSPAAYRHDPGGRWKAQDAKRWLVFLAGHLEHTIGRPDLAWWQLPLAVPAVAYNAAVWAEVGRGRLIGKVVAGDRQSPMPARRIRWQQPSHNGVLSVLGLAGAVGVGYGLWGLGWPTFGVGLGLLLGVLALIPTPGPAPLDLSSATSPPTVLAADRRTGIVAGVGYAAVMLVVVVITTVGFGRSLSSGGGLAGC